MARTTVAPDILDLARNAANARFGGTYTPPAGDDTDPDEVDALSKSLGVGAKAPPSRSPAVVSSTPAVTPPAASPAMPSATPEPAKADGMEADQKEMLWKGIIAAVPTLIGAAFGNRGGQVGAAAGEKGLAQMDADKKLEIERKRAASKDALEATFKTETLKQGADRNRITEKNVNNTYEIGTTRNKETGRHDLNTEDIGREANRIKDEKATAGAGKGDRKEMREIQNDFNKDKVVQNANTSAAEMPALIKLLNNGSGQDLNAAKFKLATMFNGSRPTDADVAAFSGAQDLFSKLEQYASMKATDKITATNRKELLDLTSTLRSSIKQNLETKARQFAQQGSRRGLGDENDLYDKLAIEGITKQLDVGDEAAKNAEIDRILGK